MSTDHELAAYSSSCEVVRDERSSVSVDCANSLRFSRGIVESPSQAGSKSFNRTDLPGVTRNVSTISSIDSMCMVLRWRTPLGKPLDDIIEDGRQKDSEQRHTQHSRENGRSQRAPHFGSGAMCDH